MYSSASARSASGARIRARTCPLHLGLDLLRELGDLGEVVHGSVDVAGLGKPLQAVELRPEALCELLRAAEALVRPHASASRSIRPRMPLTRRAASSVAYRFASTTASLIATSAGTV